MKQSKLHKLVSNVLGDRLARIGFQFEKGNFYKELPSRVLDIIMIGLDAHTNETFQMLCGVNSRLFFPDEDIHKIGLAVGKHLTSKGWSPNSGRWSCSDEAITIQALSQIKDMIETFVEPWFRQFSTLSEMADKMDTNQHGLRKALLYKAEGNIESARQTLLSYLERLNKTQPWDDPNWLMAEKDEVQVSLDSLPG